MIQSILVVDDDAGLRESLQLLLEGEDYRVTTAEDGEAALEQLDAETVDLVLCDLRMPGIDGFDLIGQIHRKQPELPVILMSAYADDEVTVEAIQRGAYDAIAKPFQPSEILLQLRKVGERQKILRANEQLQRDVERAVGDRPIVAASKPMIELLEMLERTAAFKTTALLCGESGTGKEVLARAIHAQSPRHAEPFVAVNCGAIPENLLESELFGHVKGAFTGADRARRGLFHEASGGTLFLDEIGELPVGLQVKLLRVLQEEEIRPVGDNRPQQVDVRVIAATSRDLEEELKNGRFREDLYYRLNVMRLDVPPLRERREDVPLLADHFLARSRESLGKHVRSVADDALDRLSRYAWPGNVRELENVIERAVILCNGQRITLADLPAAISEGPADGEGAVEALSLRAARRRAEITAIERALQATDGNRTHAAKRLGISHRSLLYKLREYGIR